MRLIQKTTALILTVTMLAIVLAVPALADQSLSQYWKNHIAAFPEICKNIDRNQYGGYIKALQRYMMCFDYPCRSKLYYNGGYMDGDFGGRTETAAIYLQGQLGFTGKAVDGIVGKNTWTAIANTLHIYPEYYNRIRRPAGVPGEWVFGLGPDDYFFYFGENNTSGGSV